MRSFIRNIVQRARSFLPIEGYYFDRPLLLFQSDDWGRAGIPHRETLQRLRSAGLMLGENAYDFYSLESS